ncbi:MAG: N-acetyl-gamma-glutamyl-phosphate reductase [Acidimicrobiales bacterium]
MASIGIIGASGYVGSELLRLCASHSELEVAWATGDTQADIKVGELYPNLLAAYPNLVFSSYDQGLLTNADLVFLALPHGQSAELVPELIDKVNVIVDLAADFRLRDADLYPKWYDEEHAAPELLSSFVYGLPELFRSDLVGATRIAVPGCYPTASLLALAPLARAGVIEINGIVVDAASGVSGAGRPPKANTTFCAVDENFQAYGLLDHRHTPEIEQGLSEQGLGAMVLFTPHLAPMNRGILATCYARPSVTATNKLSTASLMNILEEAYSNEPFVVVTSEAPSTKATLGSNCAHVTVRYDERTGWVMALGAIDNLVKGAAGQALQCANIALGFDETLGLPMTGLLP